MIDVNQEVMKFMHTSVHAWDVFGIEQREAYGACQYMGHVILTPTWMAMPTFLNKWIAGIYE